METKVIENRGVEFRNIFLGEPEWLYGMRKESWESYNNQPLPERVANIWRYTKPEYFLTKESVVFADALPSTFGRDDGDKHQLSDKYSAIGYNHIDGTTFVNITPELMELGVIFKDICSGVREYEHLAERFLGRLVDHNFGKFEAYNMALWNTGFMIYVPDNAIVEKPILLNRHPLGSAATTRLLAVVGKNSQATIIDDYSGAGRDKESGANSVVEIFGDDFSRIRYVNLQRLSSKSTLYMTQRAEIGRSAKIDSIFGALGGSISKVNAGAILNGKGSESRIYGILFGNEQQHFDYHTMHHHKESESLSNINFKVVLKDKAVSAYTGLIRIEKETANCEAYQENRNLLLNKGTKAESIPELEIMTDQVRCTHGATMGPIDPEMLFYLKSRGIDHDTAVRTIVSGFVEPTINKMPMDLQNMIRNMVMAKLEGNLT